MKVLRTAHVNIVFDAVTHSRLQAIARNEGKSLTALVRGLCEDKAAPIAGLIQEWESAA